MPQHTYDFTSNKDFLKALKNAGESTIIHFLARKHIDINIKDENGVPALYYILPYSYKCLSLALELKPDLTPTFSIKGQKTNLLIESSFYGKRAVAEEILNIPGYDIHHKREDAMNAISATIGHGGDVFLGKLLKAGIAPSQDILYRGFQARQWPIIRTLLQPQFIHHDYELIRNGVPILTDIIKQDEFFQALPDIIKGLGLRLDINTLDDQGYTGLYYAITRKNLKTAYHLILNGADITIDFPNKSALELEEELYDKLKSSPFTESNKWTEEIKNKTYLLKERKLLQTTIAEVGLDNNSHITPKPIVRHKI